MQVVDPTPITVEPPTETSPLLGEQSSRAIVNGDAEAGRTNGAPPEDADQSRPTQKMHLLLPAVGIGVSLISMYELRVALTKDEYRSIWLPLTNS